MEINISHVDIEFIGKNIQKPEFQVLHLYQSYQYFKGRLLSFIWKTKDNERFRPSDSAVFNAMGAII